MTLDALLATLQSRDIVLSLDGENLLFRAPAGALTPDLREAIAPYRADIIHHLREKFANAQTDVSVAEKRLWFASRLAPEETPYNVSAAFRLTGRLDIVALEAAFSDVIAAHDALRTGFHDAGGEPKRFIKAPSPFQLAQLDHSGLTAGAREPFARDLAARLSRQPIALDQPPLLRPTLVRFADDDHLLIHLIHHIITDGWSHALFCRDLAAAYRAHLAGIAWAPVARPATATSAASARQSTAVPLPDIRPVPLPRDAIRAGERPHDGHTLAVRLPARMHDLTRDLARRQRTSVATVLLAVQLLLVARLSSTALAMVAVPAAGRRDPALADRIGFHVDTLVVAAECGASMGFNDLLREVHLAFAEALDGDRGQDFSALLADRALTSFAYQATPDTPLALDGLDVATIGFERGASRFDLELHVWPLADHATSALLEPSPDSELQLFEPRPEERTGLRLMLTARSDSFSRAGAARWLRQYVQLLAACLAAPDTNLADLALVSSEEMQGLQQALERPRPLPAGGAGIAARFVEIAASHRDGIAVQGDDGRMLSYAELEAASRALGERLVGCGVMPGDIVGVAAERSAAAMVVLLAVIRAGGAYLPLDPALPDARLALMLDQAGVRHVVTSASLRDRFGSLDASFGFIVVDAGSAEAIGDGAIAMLPDPAQIAADSPAYVNFTSG
ncbi:MAG: condensation domain-containing protein, partial [Pseudomonadota bacterium]